MMEENLNCSPALPHLLDGHEPSDMQDGGFNVTSPICKALGETEEVVKHGRRQMAQRLT
jgi:hypothetical protein